MSTDLGAQNAAPHRSYGRPWLLLCAAVALHVTDEALTGFLSVYNPTALEIRRTLGWTSFPPVFTFAGWISGLAIGIVLLVLLAPLAFAGSRVFRPIATGFALLMVLNGLGHTAGTIFGRSFPDIRFSRPMPGFWSSPFLIAASVYLLVATRPRAAPRRGSRSHQ